jgi:RNA polymerase sigma-70 factor, ECF subfamily
LQPTRWNFFISPRITSSAGQACNLQDALPAFVLSSEAQRTAMNDSPANPQANAVVSNSSDEYLMLSFSKGSAEAFSVLFSRYKQPLFGFFRRRLADASHAEELTQETFLVLLRSASRYQPRALFRTYVYTIAFRILRAHRRKAVFRGTFFGVRRAAQDPVAHESPDANLAIREALAKLENTEREILLLREFEQLSYSEISDLLSLPLNTVRSRLFRARLALRNILSASAPQTVAAKLTESEERV